MAAVRVLARETLLLVAMLWIAGSDASALSVEIGLSFTGRVAPPSGAPPDTMGAVGEEHIVELLNGGLAVYAKGDGTLLERTLPLDAFWEEAGVTPVGASFDPRVLYDAASQRWFAVAVDGGVEAGGPTSPVTNRFLVAVSDTSDPTERWTGFAIDSDSTDSYWADFPRLGLDAEGAYLAAAMFPVSGGSVRGNTLVVIPKDDLLAPTPTVAGSTLFERRSLALSGFDPQPVVDLDGGGLPTKLYSGTLGFFGQIQVSTIGATVEAPTYTGGGLIAIDALPPPPDAEQPGLKPNLDSGDSRFASSIVRRNGIDWAVQSVEVDGRAAVQWLQLDPENDIVLDSGVIADPTLDLIYPSIAVNEFDEIVIGMSGSSETDFPGAYAIAGAVVGGVTTFGDLILLQAGLADYERINGNPPRNRWGDYSATVVDPEDPRHFWTFQEYVYARDTHAIRITELIVPESETLALLFLGLLGLARHRSRSDGSQEISSTACGSCAHGAGSWPK